MDSDLHDHLDELYGLHHLCLHFQHGICEAPQGKNWKLFKPSRFVYAFFTFNSIYSTNWEESFAKGYPILWDGKKERYQIKKMIQYIYCCLPQGEGYKIFHDKLQKYIEVFYIKSPVEALEHITRDRRTEVKILNFQDTFRKCWEKKSELNANEVADSLLGFIYLVRCNIFHGSKTTIEMMDEAQQQRLMIYMSILLAANETLFEAVEKRGWKKRKVVFNLTSSRL